MRSPRPKTAVALTVFLSCVLPALVSVVTDSLCGPGQRVNERLHESMEMAGSCIAVAVSLLLWLQARHEEDSGHLAWAAAALMGMGLVDGIHALAPFGLAWSWLRHGATLSGGVLFALMWVRPPTGAVRRMGWFLGLVAAAAVASSLLIWGREPYLPVPWAKGDYTPLVKLTNAVGGLGFFAGAAFFLRRYLRLGRVEDLVFASHTLIFGTAGVLFGFASVWEGDWWAWHGFRLLAYVIVFAAAYAEVMNLHARTAGAKAELERRVRERTAELQASQERLAEFAAATFEGIAETHNGIIVDCNEQLAQIVGRRVAELRGLPVRELVAPEDRARVLANVQANRESLEEHGVVRPDGTRIQVEARGRPSPKGPGWRHTALRDITQRKLAVEALREREAVLRGFFDSPGAMRGIVETVGEDDVRHVAANLESASYLGSTPEALQGKLGSELGEPPELLRMWASKHHQAERSGKAVTFEYRDARRGEKWLWATVSHLGYSAGNARFSYIVHDVTERKQAEAILARGKEELELLVAERTARLQDLVGELEHFSYTITHDLKSPLRAMRGFAEMATEMSGPDVPKEVHEALARISHSAERMDRLIADALNYSRTVRQELPLDNVDAGALLRGMLDSYPEFQPARANIRVEGPLPVILANEAGLTQCFSNLLGNAVKFVAPGEKAQIRVWATQRDGWLRLWVEDRGIGISREMLPRVFDMFARGSKQYEGTGIGLALVRKVVQRMGGRVGVESEEGKGSRFWLELKSGQASTASPEWPSFRGPHNASGTVLYVEDEEGDALFMKRAFELKGLAGSLRVVGDGRAAIQYLSGSGEYADRQKYPVPSLMLLDLNLPHVPGFQVLEWTRNNPDYAQMPVIVFSSSTREDDRFRARELGANDFYSKPSSGLEFGDVVEKLRRLWLSPAAGGT